MSARHLEWAVAGSLAGLAAARLAGADRVRLLEAAAVPAFSFTPQAAAGAWLAAMLLRGPVPAATAAAAGAAMTAAVAPRGIPRRQPPAAGPVLQVLTANMLGGRADAGHVVSLVRRTAADVLFLQELTEDAVTRLKRAGLGDLLPSEMLDVGDGASGNGIYARHRLSDGPAVAPARLSLACAAPVPAACPAARLDLPAGRPVQLACVHLRPPSPLSSRRAAAQWRDELATLPAPGDPPMIMAGDFNGTIDHYLIRRLLRLGYVDAAGAAGLGLAPTWGPNPGRGPGLLSIDHILVDRRCAVSRASIHRLPGSDHRAVYARLRLPS